MADNRFTQVPGFGGSPGFHIGQQNPTMNVVQGMGPFIAVGMPVNPMMQQQMMMASRMRSPMQGMRMGVPTTPPPPYSAHAPNLGVTSVPNRPRTFLSKTKEGQQSEKDRYFEEQRQKLRLFGKPGTVKVDPDKLIGSMFAADVKTQQSKAKSHNSQKPQDDDDGFGDFLQGPSTATSAGKGVNPSVAIMSQITNVVTATTEHKLESSNEKRDLKSMMLEYSDLSAPKKAKGFHKLTLNEVQKSGPKVTVASFHESDHSRSWKQNTEDLEGLFHLPVAPKQPAMPVATVSPESQHLVYTQQHMVTRGLPTTHMAAPFSPGPLSLGPPSGQPPSYVEVIGGTTSATGHEASVNMSVGHPGSGDLAYSAARPINLPDWCLHVDTQLPPVYMQVYEASLSDGKISTERVYPILLFSGLPREKLAQIWSLCNTATPGQLTKSELWMVLALIALTQNNYNSNSLDILARCPVAPVPFLAQIQDTNAPATLPIAPQQHQPLHQPSVPPDLAPHVALPSNTPHQQTHRVQHSRPQPYRASLTPVATTKSKNITAAHDEDDDDDFADFQVAATTRSSASVSVGKEDEVFGEFIGGGGFGSSAFSLSCPAVVPTYNHIGNGSVVMGNGSLQHPHHQPQQQQQLQEVQPVSVLLASLPVDDKYGTNVRSFFCSSDSSTGHTSPSFEDDDFTDGRDSLSQVSTSEQSENEDIRNFESYVEEYNQQKEQPSASPLHCPFPALQQNQALAGAKRHLQASSHAPVAGGAKNPGKDGDISKPDLGFSLSETAKESNNTNLYAGLNQISGAVTVVGGFKEAVSAFKVTSPISAGVSGNRSINELVDSKVAPRQTTKVAAVSEPTDVSLIGDEDKYGALRGLSLDTDFSQNSSTHQSGYSIASSSNTQEASPTKSVAVEEDDWADFSAVPAVTDDQASHLSSVPSVQEPRTEPGLKMFTGSVFEEEPIPSPTFSKGRGLDSSLSGDQLSFNSLSDLDSTITDVGWNKTAGSDWEGSGDGRYHRSDYVVQSVSQSGSNSNKVNSSRFEVGAGSSSSSVGLDLDKKSKYEDDWGQFSHNSSSTNSEVTFGKYSQNTLARDTTIDIKDVSYSDIQSNAEEDDWCDFSAANAGDGAAKDVAGVSTDEAESGDGRGKFVTIKKNNLGTNEIMGLFKVRDDPATLSSYQLPPAQPVGRNASSQGQGSHRTVGSNIGRRRSSDFDDDLAPPPMDFGHDDDDDDHAYSRGYDLDDFVQRMSATTTYSPFGVSHPSPVYSRAGGVSKLKENKEDSASIHSLDLPSSRPTNRSSSDSQSVSSADLASGDLTVAGAGVVSAESKSLDSLDLRSDNGDMDSSDGGPREGVKVLGSSSQHQPIQPQELLATMPDFVDRYNIEREAQGSDRYGYDWERCLSNCCKIIAEANTLFNTIDSSSVCNEILKSSQGSEYVTCIIEIYRVVCRVLTSMRFTAISTTVLEQTLKNIDIAWNNLSAFLVGSALLPEQTSLVFTSCILKSDSEHTPNTACGLCLLNVDAKPMTSTSQSGSILNMNSCKLTYAGRQYHAACANFWVNCVDQTLPSLTLPDLL